MNCPDGLKRLCDIDWANEFRPDYVGFVFAGKKRRVTDEQAAALRSHLLSDIPAVGVFVDEPQEHILRLLEAGTIQVVQLHGSEDEAYIKALRQQTKAPLIKAFSLESEADAKAANASSVTYVLVDHGNGLQTRYAHMLPGSFKVSSGQRVSAGQQLGNIGSSGNVTGPHLHFEVYVNGRRVNPMPYLGR